MLESPEVEAHHHKTGHSLTDLILALLAVTLSGISIFIAISHGRTMERLVAANSWPNLKLSTSNVDEHDPTGQAGSIRFTIQNTGVGPARIDSMELFYKGVPQRDGKTFLKNCCAKDKLNFSYSNIVDEVLPARDAVDFIILPKANVPGVWDTLNAARSDVRLRVCYCSVFEECFVRDTNERRPKRVEQCMPSQPIAYQ